MILSPSEKKIFSATILPQKVNPFLFFFTGKGLKIPFLILDNFSIKELYPGSVQIVMEPALRAEAARIPEN